MNSKATTTIWAMSLGDKVFVQGASTTQVNNNSWNGINIAAKSIRDHGMNFTWSTTTLMSI